MFSCLKLRESKQAVATKKIEIGKGTLGVCYKCLDQVDGNEGQNILMKVMTIDKGEDGIFQVKEITE